MTGYKSEINRLNKEISAQTKQLDQLEGVDTMTKGKPKVSSDAWLGEKALQTYSKLEMSTTGFDPFFVNTQLRQDLESNSEDVQVIENPDFTTGGGKKRKLKKKRDRNVEEAGDDYHLYAVLVKSHTASSLKCRCRISSDKSSVTVDGGKRVESKSDIVVPDNVEDKDLYTLRQEKDQVEEQLNNMKRKFEGIMWDERARGYHAIVRVCVQRFHKALMNNLGKREESSELQEVRADMECCTATEAKDGFKLGVCENFIERIEKTVLIGEIPENKLELTKTDNSVTKSVEGFVEM